MELVCPNVIDAVAASTDDRDLAQHVVGAKGSFARAAPFPNRNNRPLDPTLDDPLRRDAE